MLARFMGNEFINLPPVLDSYWRPIHVGTASLSYGVALVCFAVAVVYLLKDGVKTEAMAIWSSIFALAVFATVGHFSVFSPATFGTYGASVLFRMGSGGGAPLPVRADVPAVGWLVVASALLLATVIVMFVKYVRGGDERAHRIGHILLKLSLVTQAAAVVALVAQLKSLTNVASLINPRQYGRLGSYIFEQQGMTTAQIAAFGDSQLARTGADFIRTRGGDLFLNTQSNPVEVSALITALAGTLFVVIFSFKTDKLRAALPSLEKIDSLMYKTGGIAFAGLALLLITGAIWANESWGRYWGWDSKETGAFVAWLTYGGFLHARIARGWTGRPSAYFAIVAFLFVIFTYLGVSYLLPGLHSYA